MITVVFGDNSRFSKIKQLIGTKEYKVFDMETLNQFKEESFCNNMFGSNPILVLKRANEIPNFEFLNKIPTNRDIIIEGFDEKSEFIKKISMECTKIECRESNRDKIERVKNLFKINFKDADKLVSNIKGDFDQEIVKLELYFLNKTFTFEDADKIVLGESDSETFKSLDLLFENKKMEALKYAPKNDAIQYVYALAAVVKTLIKIKILNFKPESYDSFKIKHKRYSKILPHPYFVFKNIKIANKHSLDDLYEMSKLVTEAEQKIKTTNIPDHSLVPALIYNIQIRA